MFAVGRTIPHRSREKTGLDGNGREPTSHRSFFIAEGRSQGRLSARFRAANYPRLRTDGTLTPDFRGVLETDDGATILFSWQGYARAGPDGMRELLGSMTHVTDDERYRWLNDLEALTSQEVAAGASDRTAQHARRVVDGARSRVQLRGAGLRGSGAPLAPVTLPFTSDLGA